MDIASLANIFLSLNSCGTRLCTGLGRCRRPESEILQPIDVETVLKQGEFEWISAGSTPTSARSHDQCRRDNLHSKLEQEILQKRQDRSKRSM